MFETRKIQRRKVVVELPIFPGYIFIRMPPGARLSVLESGTVARFIYVEKPRTLVHQLHQVVKAAKSAEKLSAAPMYTEGDAVRIKYGPLKGVEGRFKRLQGKSGLLVLNVEMLGCAVEVTVDVTDCKKL